MSEEKFKYWIKANEHVHTTREPYDDDDWDAGETDLDVSLEAISCSEHSWWSRFDDDGYDCIIMDMKNVNPSPIAAAELETTGDYDLMGETDCPEGCIVEPDGICPHNYESAGVTARMI